MVTWALGHLVTLADPEDYDKKYTKWEMTSLPMLPEEMKLVVIRQSAKQYQEVKAQLFRKRHRHGDHSHRCRPGGRTGGQVDPGKSRMPQTHQTSVDLFRDRQSHPGGLSQLKGTDGNTTISTGQLRRGAEADWLVGMNGTRALTCKYNAQLSCGRVQTPTLAMIAKREEEIRNFKPREYFGLTLTAGEIYWTWRDEKSKSYRSFQKERVEEIKKEVSTGALEVVNVTSKEKKAYAPGLYDLTTPAAGSQPEIRLFSQGNPEYHAASLTKIIKSSPTQGPIPGISAKTLSLRSRNG